MASVKFRLKNPKAAISLIVVRFYSTQTGPLDFSTGENIPPTMWEGQRVSSKHKKQHDRINRHLSSIEADLLDIWRDNKAASGPDLKVLITKAVKGHAPTDEKKTVIYTLGLLIAQYSREKESTTVKMYRSILKKLEAFNPKLTFDELDFNFYDGFKEFLYNSDNPLYTGFDLRHDSASGVLTMFASDNPVHRIGLFDDAVYKYITHIKTLCHWAEKRGYPVNPSYKSWEIIKREYPIISLTLDELQRIEALRFGEGKSHLRIAKDYLSVACRTGQRISDVKRISSLAIATGTWEIHQKKGSRQKQKIVQLPLVGFCAPVVDIVQKYGGQLPSMSEQHLNKHIKTICKLAGITQEIYIERWQGNKKIRIPGQKWEYISSHSGKRSFITILGGMGVPVKVISDFTGTSIKTIERHYLGRAELYVAESYLKGIETKTLRKAQ